MSAPPRAPDVLDELAIRDAHRKLLQTLRELVAGLDDSSGAVNADDLRGAVAFLRQGILPIARWEEELLRGTPERREQAAFEHAFLAVEIDAFGRIAAALLEASGTAADDQESLAARLRRSANRIEAALEIHVSRDEERDLVARPRTDSH